MLRIPSIYALFLPFSTVRGNEGSEGDYLVRGFRWRPGSLAPAYCLPVRGSGSGGLGVSGSVPGFWFLLWLCSVGGVFGVVSHGWGFDATLSLLCLTGEMLRLGCLPLFRRRLRFYAFCVRCRVWLDLEGQRGFYGHPGDKLGLWYLASVGSLTSGCVSLDYLLLGSVSSSNGARSYAADLVKNG